MANEDKNNPPEGDKPEAGDATPDQDEQGYWKKMSSLIDDRISAGIDKKIEDIRGTRTQRTGGRTTLPKIVADFVFGPDKTNQG